MKVVKKIMSVAEDLWWNSWFYGAIMLVLIAIPLVFAGIKLGEGIAIMVCSV